MLFRSAAAANSVVVRDSANPADLILGYSAQAWQAFIADAKTGKFDISSLTCLARSLAYAKIRHFTDKYLARCVLSHTFVR